MCAKGSKGQERWVWQLKQSVSLSFSICKMVIVILPTSKVKIEWLGWITYSELETSYMAIKWWQWWQGGCLWLWLFNPLYNQYIYFFSSVQSLSRVRLFATPWTAASQASLSITNSWSLLKLMSIESVMPSNHLILCRPLLFPPSIFPSIRVFSSVSSNQVATLFQLLELSFSISPSNECFPLGLTGLISLQSKGFSRVLSNTTIQKHHVIKGNMFIMMVKYEGLSV